MLAPEYFPERQLTAENGIHSEEIWIFGFGSLIWKADFPYAQKVEGFIKGFKRVFYQGSTDHRGTPSAPGRTVTLEEDPNSSVPGVAYLLAGNIEEQRKTLSYLEWREKQYDVRQKVPVFKSASAASPILAAALVYIASPDRSANANYLGPASEEEIAQQIAKSVGPSGPNSVYLYRLTESVRKMGVHDKELEWLDARVRQLSPPA